MDSPTRGPIGRVMKTPIHTLTRVRNNQRRHRQRRREYIASLEQRLKDNEERLEQVHAENAVLRARECSTFPLGWERPNTTSKTIPEMNVITHRTSAATSASREIRQYPPDAEVTYPGSASVDAFAALPPKLPSQEVGSEPDETTTVDDILSFPLSPNLPISVTTELAISTTHVIPPSEVFPRSACCSRTSPDPNILNSDTCWLGNQASVDRTPVLVSSSSTTLCSQAYVIIQHHTRCQLPMDAVERWLWPGLIYSTPSAEHGCRVDNQLLLGLLDYITEWESRSVKAKTVDIYQSRVLDPADDDGLDQARWN